MDSSALPDDRVAAFQLFQRLGKRVLRPGGRELTTWLLDELRLPGATVVELAAGAGDTGRLARAHGAASYIGVDLHPGDPEHAVRADAATTGLAADSADVVFGEALLSMQGDGAKHRILTEATRLLRPGGRFGLHELALVPDSLDEDARTRIRRSLAQVMHVNARPLTVGEWTGLLAVHGLTVEAARPAPMALLQPRRLIADEGVPGAARFVGNVLRRPDARHRILAIRRTLREHRAHLAAVAIVAHL
ncbi:class I SAM-dependent methyltransferase [Actinoplanes sp. TRM 88003]|uniref:Class I SAM-dependent methyltransferase n=1 Tax=Paractinoplanes aksuensis TaxID=2939490 RepID=A0ABT1DXB7_9ACTN|nr:class I SAM-dependent methyltransferase [Actinoplanes aksuensis]MCO8275203.1 class I SAM-dependent methyltransferase [Actinoplanes aksuensis]